MVLIDNSIDLMSKWNRHKIELKFGNHRNIALQKESQVLQEMAVEELNINEADIYILKVKLPYPPKIKRSVLLIKRLIENGNLKIVINRKYPLEKIAEVFLILPTLRDYYEISWTKLAMLFCAITRQKT